MIKDYTTKRREFVDTIIKNGIISVNEIHKEMIKNDFSNGYSTDKNYIYSRLKTLGVDLIKIKILEVGTIFGDLTVLEHIGSDKHGQIYRFKCTCGNIIERNSNRIPKSCGCKKQYYIINARICNNCKERQNKIKETNIERYGVEYSSQNQDIKNKRKETSLKNDQKIILEKRKLTNIERYGFDYNFVSDDFKINSKKTMIERYGVEHPIHSEDCLLYTSPSPRDRQKSRMPSSA